MYRIIKHNDTTYAIEVSREWDSIDEWGGIDRYHEDGTIVDNSAMIEFNSIKKSVTDGYMVIIVDDITTYCSEFNCEKSDITFTTRLELIQEMN